MTITPGQPHPFRLAYLVSHPIQYQAPLLRRIGQEKEIDLTVFFRSDISLHAYYDSGFGQDVTWDVPLVEGYDHVFLPAIGPKNRLNRVLPVNYGLGKHLKRGDFDALWIHGYATWFNMAAMVTAKRCGVPVLIRDEAHASSKPRSKINKAFKHFYFRLLERVVDGYLAIGSLNKDYYLENGIAPENIFLMPYCVDNDFFMGRSQLNEDALENLRREAGIEPEDKAGVILFASKFVPRKCSGDLLKAYEIICRDKAPSARPHLLFIGDGEEKEELARRASQSGLERVRFLGFKNQTELPGWFALADVFVLPSQNEPWGLAVNEAMCGGCAVIASNQVGAAKDLIKEGVNGFTFPVGNVEALAQALTRVLSSRQRLDGMKTASLKRIRNWGFKEDISGLKKALIGVMK